MAEKSLKDFIEEVTDGSHLRVQDDLGDGFVRLKAAEAQRRQAKQDIRSFEDVVIEMLRNSRDAHAKAIFVATWKEGNTRYMTMIDNGDGVPANLHETIFEPFVTSKLDTIHTDRWGVHGRGMALYSIRENCSKAHLLNSSPGLGSVFTIESNCDLLTEKRDQSSLPTISKDENGVLVLRGPHNILRTALEFSIDERKGVTVYLGSPIEIASTLYNLNMKAVHSLSSIFNDDVDQLPYIQRLACAYDAESFVDIADSLGLPLSARSAHRIIKGETEPLYPMLQLVSAALTPEKPKTKSKKHSGEVLSVRPNQKSFKLDDDAIRELEASISRWYNDISESYYLEDSVEPKISVSKNEIKITIPVIHSS